MIKVGIVATVMAAAMIDHSMVYSPWKDMAATGRVFMDALLMKVRANISSFQEFRKEKMAIVAIGVLTIGSMIRKKVV